MKKKFFGNFLLHHFLYRRIETWHENHLPSVPNQIENQARRLDHHHLQITNQDQIVVFLQIVQEKKYMSNQLIRGQEGTSSVSTERIA